MAAVWLVAWRRLARQWSTLAAAGLLLGLGFGLCFASVAAARRTASAYDRILVAADAPDAAVALGGPPDEAEQALATVDGIVGQRVYAGFIGTADGVERILTTALIAPTRDRFPIELPQLRAGRFPEPDAPEEALVNESAARAGGFEVGQRLHFRFVNPFTGARAQANMTIVGIGAVPAEAVSDETSVVGLFVFTRAFYEAHRDLASYAVSNVDLAPGVDARRDLGAPVGALGHQLQSARPQEQQAINEALRPLLIVLVAFGVLAFGATTVAAAQVVQRNRDRWLSDDETLRSLGLAGGQVRLVALVISGAVAVLAVVAAIVTMALASPLAPVGPLHDLDPAQGFGVDGAVALVGAAAIVVVIGLVTLAFSSARIRGSRHASSQPPWIASVPGGPTTIAGLTLAFRADSRLGRVWRSVAATTMAAAVLSLCAAFLASAVTLTETPRRYGFDADLLAVNAYGDQAPAALERAFGNRRDVVAASGFTSGSYLIDGRAVPGLAETSVKGQLGPTILRGRALRSPGEIVVGQDTLDSIGSDVGDVARVQLLRPFGAVDERAGDPLDLKIVGVATFPAVNQIGTDMPRLGTGALVTRGAFLRMLGDPANQPEFSYVRLEAGTDPAVVIEDNGRGFRDAAQSTTSWFTDAKPAELLQLDEAMPYLRGALAVGYAILLAVIVHALWTRARVNRHERAVLRVVGCSHRQLDAVTAWQVVPFVLAAALLGVPLGIAVGRRAFTEFAQSLAVVDDASTTPAMWAALVAAVLLAALVADLVAIAVARRTRVAAVLREA
jgi:putative ABC transport system permease protein